MAPAILRLLDSSSGSFQNVRVASGNFGTILEKEGDWRGKTGRIGDQNDNDLLTDHYEVTFNLAWLDDLVALSGEDTKAWFHFTQECGNDNLMGMATWSSTAPGPVPEPATLGLLFMGIVGIAATRLRRYTTQ